MLPKLSVIVPVYNVEEYIENCLTSLLNQTFEDFEVIIVNDGSSDSSVVIARSFADADPRFKVISQTNLGLGGARNTGINNAKGDYLFMLDSDDYIKSTTFHDLVKHSEKNDLDILVFNYDKIDQDGNLISSSVMGKGNFSKEQAFSKIISLRTSPQACNKLFKRSLFTKNNIFFREQFLHEDLNITYRLFWNANKIGYLDKSYYYWVVRDGSITSNFGYKHINDIVISLSEIKLFMNNNSVYAEFEKDYVVGCVKMFNLLLERSIQHAKYGCMDYLLFLINGENILSNKQMEALKGDEAKLNLKYEALKTKVETTLSELTLISTDNAEIAPALPIATANKTRAKYNSWKLRLKKIIYKTSYYFFPIESKRRTLLKRVIGR